MKDSKKTIVRVLCLGIAVLMAGTLFASLMMQLLYY